MTARRLTRVRWDGAPRWLERMEDRSLLLTAGDDPGAAGVAADPAPPGAEDAPVLPPAWGAAVVGVAYNHRSLVGDVDDDFEPLLFLKGPRSPAAHGAAVTRPDSDHVWVEVELAVVIGAACHAVSAAEARERVLGLTVGSDMTCRNVHDRDHHLARSKALDGFAPLGPDLVCGADPGDRRMSTEINGERTQDGATSDMLLDPFECVALASRFLTLLPGDVILTGTPAGAMESRVDRGDRVAHEIEGIGRLEFTIA